MPGSSIDTFPAYSHLSVVGQVYGLSDHDLLHVQRPDKVILTYTIASEIED